ncbi:cytochrome c oxidase assembly protein [Curtobacterium sp. P97]|uniref:cytochrome c oxidase assembly protein n=1 Tax=unclassified Curtobacterium TaxID=257496 RepID=UPI00203BBF5D|nr:cytochrome c oxidase assembly protein [Curtobacterium sp. P97]MCM3522621.1 cytochrome c oxidase assembly protein [Curtobacterium sp. P97]
MPRLDSNVLWSWATGPLSPVAVVAVLLATTYLVLYVNARRGPRAPALGRAVVFILGCAVMFTATTTGLQTYSRELLSAFMFQQLTLLLIVPPLLILGSPGTVLLRGMPRRGFGRRVLRLAVGVLRSSFARLILHPLAVVPLLVVPLFGLYLTGAADALLSTEAGRIALQLTFVALGTVIMLPLATVDPLPRRTSYVIRIVDAFVEMQIHAAFGLTLMFSSAPLVATFASPSAEFETTALRDQQLAGGLVWTYGELPVAIILLASIIRWQRQDSRKAARATREADRHGDTELDNYNAYLQGLRQGSGR